ncbi:major facilitator superfamily domain-containing protein [Phyllosticta capitalensis]
MSEKVDVSESNYSSSEALPSSYTADDAHGGSADKPNRVRAAIVVAGGFIAYFVTFGLLNTFGTFETYYHDELLHGYNPSTISWIGSIQLFLLFIGGMFAGPAFDAFGARAVFIPGGVLYVFSLMMTSLCKEYYQLALAQGVLYGIANAMLFYPTISTIQSWFSHRRGLATGIVISGSSIGGIVWPIIIQKLFNTIGFAWTVRTVAFICLGLLIPASWFIVEKKTSGPKPPLPKDAFSSPFKDGKYLVTTASFFFIFWGMFLPFYYLPTYGLSHGMSKDGANYLLAYLNAGSFFGRLFSGWMADKIGPFNITVLCSVVAGVLALGLYANQEDYSLAGTVTFSVLFGLFSGGLISLQATCVTRITPHLNVIGLRIGLMLAICSFGALTGAPLGGALLSDRTDWDGFLGFTAASLLFGALLAIWARFKGEKRLMAAF